MLHSVHVRWNVRLGFILTWRLAQVTYTVVNEMNEMSENDVSQKVKYVYTQMLPSVG